LLTYPETDLTFYF